MAAASDLICAGGALNSAPGAVPLEVFDCAGWTVHDYEVVDSSNRVAASLPPWHAVRATIQTAGRGRFHRSWVSDKGGLWISAVVPISSLEKALLLPLLSGLVLCSLLRQQGLSSLRMRWPNDILVGHRKLAGILVDAFPSGKAVIGVGINLSNHPESLDSTLNLQTARLADLLPHAPSVDELTLQVLETLRRELEDFTRHGEILPLARVNQLWGSPRHVELDLDGPVCRGLFKGVDLQGRLELAGADGATRFYSAHQVRHLTEIEN